MFQKILLSLVTISTFALGATSKADDQRPPRIVDCNVYLEPRYAGREDLNEKLESQGFTVVDNYENANFMVSVFSLDRVVSFAEFSMKPRKWDHAAATIQAVRRMQDEGGVSKRALHRAEKELIGELIPKIPACDTNFLSAQEKLAELFGPTYFNCKYGGYCTGDQDL